MIVYDKKPAPSKPKIVYDDPGVSPSSKEVAPNLRDFFSGRTTDPMDKALTGVSKGVAAIPAAFWNQFGMNAPRAAMETYGKQKYPAPGLFDKITTYSGELGGDQPIPMEPLFGGASKVAGAAGAAASLPGRAILKLFGASTKAAQGATKIPYLKKMLAAGTAGAAYSPEDPLDMKARAYQGAGSALIGPAAERVMSGLSKMLPRAMRRVALGEGSTKIVKKIREVGPENVFTPEKESPDYLSKTLRPQVEDIVKGSAKSMNPKTLRELGMDQETIDILTSLKPDEIQEARYSGHLGDVVSDVKRELANAVNYAKRDYSDTIKKIPLKSRLQPGGYKQGLSEALEGMFKPNGKGFRQDLQEATLHSRKPFMALYSQLNKQLKAAKNGQGFDKTQYVLLHDHLIKLQQSPDGFQSRTATILKEALEADAQKFGFGDIAGIKDRYKTGKEFEPFLAKTNLNSRQLARELTPEQKSQFQALEKYLGKEFLTKAQRMNALSEYDELVKSLDTDKTKLASKTATLLRESQGDNRAEKVEELGRFVGSPEKGAAISKNVLANKLAQYFGERGTYPTKAGVIRSGARGMVKKYEETRAPLAKKGAEVSAILKNLLYGENKALKATGAAASKKLKNEGGYIRFGGQHPDMYEYDPLKPAAMKRDGKIIEKWVYNPRTEKILPVTAGESHAYAMDKRTGAGAYSEMIRGINKGNITLLRPSMNDRVVQNATYGDPKAWEQIRQHQTEQARKLFWAEPGRKVILASGGPNSQLPFFEDAAGIPENAFKLADPRYVYTVPQLTPAERRMGSAFTKTIDPEFGGVTFKPTSDFTPKKGYAVSIDKKYEFKKPEKAFDVKDIETYYDTHAHVISKKGNYVGMWKENGIIYMDISTVEPDKTVAMRLGKNRGQLAVYGFEEGQTFRIGERSAENLSRQKQKVAKIDSRKAQGRKKVKAGKGLSKADKVKAIFTDESLNEHHA